MKKLNYKKAFYITFSVALVLVLFLGTIVFLNVDYIMFKYFITTDYLYTDTMDKAFKEDLGLDIDGKYYKYFDNLAIEELSDLLSEIGEDPFTYQYTPQQYSDYVAWRETKAATAYTEEINKQTLYLLYPNFTDDSYDFMQSNIAVINEYENLIIDLRGNGGGDLDVLFDLCGLFVGNNKTIMIEKTRSFSKAIKSNKKQQIYVNNIYILINEHTASASESFSICLKELNDKVTIIGTDSYGKGIGQTRINLTKGFYSKATTLEWLSPEGNSIHKAGVIPDIYYEKDDIVDYVINTIIK